MGNYMYCESSPPVKRDIQPYNESVSKLLSLNVQFSKTCPHPYFINFHQKVVELDIKKCHALAATSKLLQSSSNSIYDEEQFIYREIKNDLNNRAKHPYNEILQHYLSFINELFDLNMDVATHYHSPDIRVLTELAKTPSKRCKTEEPDLRIEINNHNKNTKVVQKFNHLSTEIDNFGKLIIEQLSLFFTIFRFILNQMYGQQLTSHFHDEIGVARELLIQRVYEKDILSPSSPLTQVICCALYDVYHRKSALLASETFSPPVLHPSLLPKSRFESVHSLYSGQLDSLLNDEDNLLRASLQRIPYNKTFATLDKIINAYQPWLKFKLIGKLDKQIVDIYLQSRTPSQASELKEIIQAEDAKVDIIAYILQKYMSINFENIEKTYYELRWMYDQDSVITPKLKSYYCPYFTRFLALYEIAYLKNNKKQKQ